MTIERNRLRHDHAAWTRWGPYLAERAWGTVREDYSEYGTAWEYFSHDQARSRAYRWNEDGLGGISDDKGRVCFALALWNGRDPILKERLFGLTGNEGNHGEDVKEYYYYLDSTPSHSFMRMLYKYPQREYPYGWLVEENHRRGRDQDEFELLDTGIFDDDRYFDIFVEYAKASPDDILIQIRAVNRGPEAAPLWLLPTLWFRNTWSWGYSRQRGELVTTSIRRQGGSPIPAIAGTHPLVGEHILLCEGADELLFTENETNFARIYGAPNRSSWVKDAFHEYVIRERRDAIDPEGRGTKAAALYKRTVGAGEEVTICLRLCTTPGHTVIGDNTPVPPGTRPDAGTRSWSDVATQIGGTLPADPFADFAATFAAREREADDYYAALLPATVDPDLRRIHRQALAGMLWSKQFYHYVVNQWLTGDPGQPPPPVARRHGRNHEWRHLYNERVMSMPDKWEYPWYAAWDLAFHCVPLAVLDPEFARSQLDLLLREWYQHPNGQIPAYEWAFGDVNPPVIAWAAWRVYKIEQEQHGRADRQFLERTFHKLMLNFTWWVNRKDEEGNNVFQGGFLGLDNIGVFDRSAPSPPAATSSRATAPTRMAMFCLNLMQMALELARENSVYEDIAVKFFEHFLAIAAAMNTIGDETGEEGISLWNEEDQFYYDVLRLPEGLPPAQDSILRNRPDPHSSPPRRAGRRRWKPLPNFRRALEWYLDNRPDVASLISRWHVPGRGERRLLAICRGHRLKRLLRRALDEQEFLSDYGVQALSRYHHANPYVLHVNGADYVVRYEPAESRSGIFGGNSNWRGPIWFPVNYLLIESLQRYHHYFSDDFTVECPTNSGQYLTLGQIADDLARRLIALFARDADGRRPVFGADERFQRDPHWRDHPLFYEYFHGDDGSGRGASHQTGWTGLVATLIEQLHGAPAKREAGA
ncbi:MAG: glucosidase [Chloroflexia bacterium]